MEVRCTCGKENLLSYIWNSETNLREKIIATIFAPVFIILSSAMNAAFPNQHTPDCEIY
jgi:hypothetical protein